MQSYKYQPRYSFDAITIGGDGKEVRECPFSLLTQFDKWWTWHYRVFAKRENALGVSCEMLGMFERVRNRIEAEILRGKAPW